MKADLDKARRLKVTVEGVSLFVRLDEHGKPSTVTAGAWLGGDEERLAKLAIKAARLELERAAERKRDAARTAKATKTKRKLAAEFWGNEWLEKALEKCPGCRPSSRDSSGEHPLALAARNAIEEKAQREPEFKQHEHFKHRARITNHRARRFLETRATD